MENESDRVVTFQLEPHRTEQNPLNVVQNRFVFMWIIWVHPRHAEAV